MRLTVTTTALPRPDLFRQTLDSFKKNLQGIDWEGSTIVLNVDPLPLDMPELLTGETLNDLSRQLEEQSERTSDVCAVANQFFGRVIGLLWEQRLFEDHLGSYGPKSLWAGSNVPWPQKWPIRGSHPAAVKRVFETASRLDNDFVFHLEDDWELLVPIDIETFLEPLRSGWMQSALLPLDHNEFVLCPSFLTKQAALMAASFLDPKGGNPELQVRANPFFSGRTQTYPPRHFNRSTVEIVRDLGTEWRETQGFQKNKGAEYVCLEKKESELVSRSE